MNPPSSPANVLRLNRFKQITSANLLLYDDHPSHPSPLRGEKWLKECLKPKLEPSVPQEVAFLYEVARGSMI